jgi:hypothetical protein
MRRIVIAIAGIVAASLPTARAQTTGPNPGEIGRLGAAARPLGLGEAFTAVADPSAVLWNPAALSAVQRGTFHVSHRDVQTGLRIGTGNLAVRLRQLEHLALGISATLLQRDAAGAGTQSDAEFVGNVGTAFQVTPALALGLEFGRVESTFQDPDVARGWNTGAGMLWSRGPTAAGVAVRGLSFGMSGADGDYPYRYRLSAGVAHQFDSTLLFAAQVDRDRAADPVFGMGAEWTPDPRLALRGGVRQQVTASVGAPLYSTGAGVQEHGVSVDYAARFSDAQAPEHVVSVGYRFGTRPAHDEPTPQVAIPSAAATSAPAAAPPPVTSPVAVVPEPQPARRQPAQRPPQPAPPRTDADARATPQRDGPLRYIVRAGVHLDVETATVEVARFYRAKLRPVIERRGNSHVVVLLRCQTLAEARSWVKHAADHGLRCYIDEE